MLWSLLGFVMISDMSLNMVTRVSCCLSCSILLMLLLYWDFSEIDLWNIWSGEVEDKRYCCVLHVSCYCWICEKKYYHSCYRTKMCVTYFPLWWIYYAIGTAVTCSTFPLFFFWKIWMTLVVVPNNLCLFWMTWFVFW